jgi:hypothetical protein
LLSWLLSFFVKRGLVVTRSLLMGGLIVLGRIFSSLPAAPFFRTSLNKKFTDSVPPVSGKSIKRTLLVQDSFTTHP